jgi:hypothetical protein
MTDGMNGDDLVAPLKAAIQRADPSWVTQPSHLRRRLDEELGPDARSYRAQVHQLVVAAEERIPIRLRRNGDSPAERIELVNLLVVTRGWTEAASQWAVATWAAALDLSDDRPAVAPTAAPLRQVEIRTPDPTDHARPIAPADPTVLPSEMATAAPADFEPERPAETGQPQWSAPRPAAAGADGAAPFAVVAPAEEAGSGPARALPDRAMRGSTKKAAEFLDRSVDVAYVVKVGKSPAWLFLLIVFSVGVFLATGLVPLMFVVAFSIAWTVWPARVLAVSGNQVWLLEVTRFSSKPTSLISETSREHIEFAGGWPMSSVRLDGQRLWLPLPVFAAAKRLPAGPAEDPA